MAVFFFGPGINESISQEAAVSGKLQGDFKQNVCMHITDNRQRRIGWWGGSESKFWESHVILLSLGR